MHTTFTLISIVYIEIAVTVVVLILFFVSLIELVLVRFIDLGVLSLLLSSSSPMSTASANGILQWSLSTAIKCEAQLVSFYGLFCTVSLKPQFLMIIRSIPSNGFGRTSAR